MGELFSFGEWVRRRRKALDLTQGQLAESVGCAAITIRRIEADSLRPSRQISERLADCLVIPADDRVAFLQAARAERAVDRLSSPAEVAPPSPPVVTRRSNLPLALTSFVGRTSEVAELTQLLQSSRLITITGIGGTGKTRLGLHLAQTLIDSYADGVWLVGIAPVRDPYFVVQAVANVLGIHEQAGQPLLRTLTDALRDKQVLLLLDNCEHLTEACSELSAALLQDCARLQILATSHEPLNLLGEQLYPLPPLATPLAHVLHAFDDLDQVESVRLFCERARAVQPSFALSAANAAVIAEICRRLDGLPLAIELAVVHIRHFPLELLLERLHQPLALLVSGPRNLPERQQTLRTTIDWSYHLLSPAEQRLFAGLGVFVGGWTLAAAEAVCGALVETEAALVDVLTALLDKSLIRPMESAAPPRFVMLETIRLYAHERLAESDAGARLHWQHASFYLALVERAEPELAGAQAGEWLDRLAQEHENLRAALTWLLSGADQLERRLEQALRLCAGLWRFWWLRGYLHEGRRWLDQTLARPEPVDPALRGRVLRGAGVIARTQGDLAAATALISEGLKIAKVLDDTLGVALAVNSLGVLFFNQSDYEQAGRHFAESLTLYQALGDQRRVAVALNNLGNIAYKSGDLDRAGELYLAGLRILTEDVVDQQTLALIKVNLGEIARVRKAYSEAVALLYESATIYSELNGLEGMLLCLNNLAEIAIDQQHGLLAARLLGAEDALYERIGAVRSPDLAADYARQVAALHQQISQIEATTARLEGRATPIDQILSQALDAHMDTPLGIGGTHE